MGVAKEEEEAVQRKKYEPMHTVPMNFLLVHPCLDPAGGGKSGAGGDGADEHFPIRVLLHVMLSQALPKSNKALQ
jgi:hypothetical protein